jgi:NADH-quinone oxidoreductase subunit L
MVMALGLGGRVAGMYHLTTHAFFKALLFLAAGSVIHAAHEQDIWKLGGLWRSMRWTSATFLIGALALCGFPGLSGFFSKDKILVLAHEHNPALYWLGTVTAGLTAFYIARAWFVAFTGPHTKPGSPREQTGFGVGAGKGRVHESPPAMLVPLFLLAGLSIAGGYLGIPHFLGEQHGEFHWDVAAVSLVVVTLGLALAWLIYQRRAISAQQLVQALALPYSFLQRRYYIDELYNWYVANIQQKLLAGLCAAFERYLIIGLGVNGTAALTRGAGKLLRLCQTGKVQTYALVFLAGVVWLLAASLRP